MPEETNTKAPWWFWTIGVVALIWNLMGVAAYLAQVSMDETVLAAMPAAERAIYEAVPAWATAAFAIAVFGGALGCAVLLLRKAWAFHVLILSLVGVLVQMYHAFFLTRSIEVYGPGGMIMPVMVIVLSVFLVWFARFSQGKGWLT